MKLKLSLVAVLTLLLSACATQAVKPPMVDAATAEQWQLARESELRAQDAWSLNGRVALSNGRNGGSGRIEWKQDGTKSEVALSAPVTRQSWRLTVDGRHARIDGLEGGPRTGTNAGALLRETTGWVIPVASLGEWVRGVRAKKPAPTDIAYDAQGRLSRLVQDGWTIDYRWPEGAITPAALPVRVDAVKGEAKVKLIVDEWQSAGSTHGKGG